MRPRRLGRGVMKGRHLIPGVVALAFAAPAFAGEPPVGNWRIVEADYSDQGHCAVTETIEISLSLRRVPSGVEGEYVEAQWRDGDFGNCRRLGGFRATYTGTVSPASAGSEGYVARLTLRDCRDRGEPHCRDLPRAATKPLKRSRDRDGVVLDGIFLGRDG